MELIDCPEIVDGQRCNAPCEITRRDELMSTDGLIEHIGTMCILGHRLFMPIDMLNRGSNDNNRRAEG